MDALPSNCHIGETDNLVHTAINTSKLQDSETVNFPPKLEFDDADIDDDLDPAMREQLDRSDAHDNLS